MSIRILSPEGGVGSRAVDLAPAPRVLAGLRIALLDNGKPGAAQLLGYAADALAARARLTLAGIQRKKTAATPCEEVLLEEISQRADLVLTAVAD